MMQKDYARVHLRVHGRVQGVGFRWFVVAEAQRLGLHGWVRNAADGSVELEAAGPAAALGALRERLAEGPPAARVRAVQEIPPGSDALPDGFRVTR